MPTLPRRPHQLHRLHRHALSLAGCALIAIAATTACTNQASTLNAQDTQEFAQAYAGLVDGTVDTTQYEAVVADIAARLDAPQAQELTECADALAKATDASMYRDLKESLGAGEGEGALVPQGSESARAGEGAGDRDQNDALRNATDNLAQQNADITRCAGLLGVTLTP